LFVIDFPGSNQFSFFLDRKFHRITLDVAGKFDVYSKHFGINNLNETTVINNLAISFKDHDLKINFDCKNFVEQEVGFKLSEIYGAMDEPSVKLLRERKYPLYVELEFDDCEKVLRKNPSYVKANKSKGDY
jgi:hypothetical protein